MTPPICYELRGKLNAAREFYERVQEISRAARAFGEEMDAPLRVFKNIANYYIQPLLTLYPNKRVVYLATHGKKRVQKKNIKRIFKYFEREGE